MFKTTVTLIIAASMSSATNVDNERDSAISTLFEAVSMKHTGTQFRYKKQSKKNCPCGSSCNYCTCECDGKCAWMKSAKNPDGTKEPKNVCYLKYGAHPYCKAPTRSEVR